MSLLLSLGLTPIVLRVAVRRQVLDHPGGHKGHVSPIPYLGGVAIAFSFAVTVVAATVFLPYNQRGAIFGQLVVTFLLALGLCVLGLIDDLRGVGPGIRFALEALAGFLLFVVGVRVSLFEYEILDALITVLWVVGITNAFNFLDNMDGLSAGITAISSFFFFLIAALNGQFLVAGLSAALVGCAIGFLKHNFHPAKIYMGDAGSLFFGFLLAVLGIKLRFDAPVQITFMVPILVLGVAIFDTVLVIATRLINRKSPWAGGRDHSSHRLVFVGIPVPVAVALVYAAQVALGWLAIVMSRVDTSTGFILMGFVTVSAVILGVLLGTVPVYDRSTRRRMMIQEVKPHEVEPPGPGLSTADMSATQ